MKNMIRYNARTLGNLPTEVSNDRVNAAILPAKIEAASRAIAACESLPELLKYRSQAEGLAAAVKIMKKTAPDMVRAANNLVADAWRKGGELLLQYNGDRLALGGARGTSKSDRSKTAEKLGLGKHEVTYLTRLAAAPAETVRELAQSTSSLFMASARAPLRVTNRSAHAATTAYRRVMGSGDYPSRLTTGGSCIRRVDIDDVRALDASEKKLVRVKVAEIMELLDAIDAACK
jgi:hypothetical protein